MSLKSDVALGLGAVVGLAVVAVIAWQRGGRQVVTQGLNPLSDRNYAYGGVNAVGAAVSGNPSFSLGSWLFEVMNPGAVQAERDALGGAVADHQRRPDPPSAGIVLGDYSPESPLYSHPPD
jgi:hypothetical protein